MSNGEIQPFDFYLFFFNSPTFWQRSVTTHLAFSVRNEASRRGWPHRQRLHSNDPPLFNYNTPSYVARRQSNYWLQWTGPGLYFLHFFFLSPSSFCSSRQQHLVDVGWWRVYTLSCTRQRFTYRYVPAIVAITSPLMALHNVICRPAPFLSDLFAPIVIPLLPSPLFTFLSRPLFRFSPMPDFQPSIPSFPTARGEIECLRLNVLRSIFGISRCVRSGSWDERWNFKIWRIYIVLTVDWQWR